MADYLGIPNPSADDSPAQVNDLMALLDNLAIDAYKKELPDQIALAYDMGTGMGYIGFSETMRLLDRRFSQSDIKTISFSDRKNISRLYTDAAAITGNVEERKYDKCVELLNVMADAGVLTALSVYDSQPQYLLLARKSPYSALADRFPLYRRLKMLAEDEANHVILTP